MDADAAARVLSLHNDYRRGFIKTMQDPVLVGQAIDLAVAVLLTSPKCRIDGAIVTCGLPNNPKRTYP